MPSMLESLVPARKEIFSSIIQLEMRPFFQLEVKISTVIAVEQNVNHTAKFRNS